MASTAATPTFFTAASPNTIELAAWLERDAALVDIGRQDVYAEQFGLQACAGDLANVARVGI